MANNVVLLSLSDGASKWVLTQGYRGRLTNRGDYAVYKGNYADTDQYIATTGNKVRWEEAQELFPRHVTSEGMYRR